MIGRCCRLVGISLFGLLSSVALAGEFQLTATFRASDSEPGDRFGSLVDLSGDAAIVRSRVVYGGQAVRTQTHVFRQSEQGVWAETSLLSLWPTFAPIESAGAFLGHEAAIDDGQIMLGLLLGHGWPVRAARSPASVQFLDIGSKELGYPVPYPAFDEVFGDRSYPSGVVRLQNVGKGVGRSVAISGNVAIASDPAGQFSRVGGPPSIKGAAHIFIRDEHGQWNWSEPLFLEYDPSIGQFGVEVAIDGNIAGVSSTRFLPRQPEGRPAGEGNLYIFEKDIHGGWQQTDFIGAEELNFVWSPSIEISGNTLAARSILDGATALYEKSNEGGWSEVMRFSPGPIQNSAGRSIALDGEMLAMTRFSEDSSEVEVYRRNAESEWSLFDTISAPEADLAPVFGSSLSLDHGRLLVGASSTTPNASFDFDQVAGAAYLYTLVPEPSTSWIAITAMLSWSTTRRREC